MYKNNCINNNEYLGKVVMINNKYYCIYYQHEKYFLVCEIKYNKTIQYTDFEVSVIPRPVELEVVNQKNEDFIIDVTKQCLNGFLKVGQVCQKHSNTIRYIITDVCKDVYECLSIEQIKEGIFSPKYIPKVDVVVSPNQSLDGIKFFEKNSNFNMSEIYKNEVIDDMFEEQQQYLINNKKHIKQKIKM